MKKKILLVVDDFPSVIDAVQLALETEDVEVIGAANEGEAIARFKESQPDAILLDIMFGSEPKGWEILKKIRDQDQSVVVLIFSATESVDQENKEGRQFDGFLSKSPWDINQLKKSLKEKGVI